MTSTTPASTTPAQPKTADGFSVGDRIVTLTGESALDADDEPISCPPGSVGEIVCINVVDGATWFHIWFNGGLPKNLTPEDLRDTTRYTAAPAAVRL